MGDYRPIPGWHGQIDGMKSDLAERLGRAIQADAERAAPVDTGHLRGSFSHTSNSDGCRVSNSAHYFPYVELGHRVVVEGDMVGWVPPQPSLRPALYRARL